MCVDYNPCICNPFVCVCTVCVCVCVSVYCVYVCVCACVCVYRNRIRQVPTRAREVIKLNNSDID